MITEIHLENFQGFKFAQTIPIAPLTYIFGPNSSGKSAIFRGINFMRQCFIGLPSSKVEYESNELDLSSFRNVVHGHDETQTIKIGVRSSIAKKRKTPTQEKSVEPNKYSLDSSRIEFRVGSKYGVESISVQIEFSSQDNDDAASKPLIEFIFDAKQRGDESFGIVNWALRAVHADADALRKFTEMAAEQFKTPEYGVQKLRNLSASFKFDAKDFIGKEFFIFLNQNDVFVALMPETDSEQKTFDYGIWDSGGLTVFQNLIGFVMSRVFADVRDTTWLGPLRSIPSGITNISGKTARLTKDASNLQSVFASASETTRSRISEWVSKLSEEIYELRMSPIETSIFGDLGRMTLFDRHTQTEVQFKDVGVGFSQIIPVIVSLYGQPTTNLIEQPELHLHPRMQAKLTDLFIDRVAKPTPRSGRGVGGVIIVETHSENLLLRLERRLREKVIKTSDVSVVFVDRSPLGGSEASQVRYSADGDPLDSWPISFSELRWDEQYGG